VNEARRSGGPIETIKKCKNSCHFFWSHLTALAVKHWPNCQSCESCEFELWHLSFFLFFFMRTCVLRVPNMNHYAFSTHLELSNGKQVFPCSKKQSPMSVAFHYAVVIIAHKALCQRLSIRLLWS
jgi:hypothetical protein